MASEEHKLLSDYIKDVHLSLRKSTFKLGAKTAWQKHCENKNTLLCYAQCMEKLATTHWENQCKNTSSEATSRIQWVVDYCYDYFINKNYVKATEKEIIIANKIQAEIKSDENFTVPLKLIDVGSCYNPFNKYDIFNVFAIDLYPANSSVLQCDFLNVNIGLNNIVKDTVVREIQENSYDIVTFCFLLEYIPTSELRVVACEKAYKLLKPGGLLIITTPDSKHVGANSKIMKCWRFALAHIGFNRIKYEKLKFMHCMAFRKTLNKEVALRWATLYKEPYMEYAIPIPQDSNNIQEDTSVCLDNETDKPNLEQLYKLDHNVHLRGHPLRLWRNSAKKNPMRHFLPNRVVTAWNKFPENVVMAPSLNCFKNRLDKHISKLLETHASAL